MLLEKQRLLDEVYTYEIRTHMAKIEDELAGNITTVDANLTALEAEITQTVPEHVCLKCG